MKKFSFKSFFAGILVCALISSFGAYAASTTKSIQATYNGYKINVDGTKISPKDDSGKAVDLYTINGTLYAPVKYLSGKLGYDFAWSKDQTTVDLKKAQVKAPAASTKYSRTNPAPLDTYQTIVVKDYSNDYTATMKVREVKTGDEAWKILKETNSVWNKEPKSDEMYILAKVKVKVDKVNNDKAVSLASYDFKCFSDSNVEYQSTTIIEPEPELTGKLFAGGDLEGYVAFLVKKSDPAPKIVYGMNYDGTGGIWFKITK